MYNIVFGFNENNPYEKSENRLVICIRSRKLILGLRKEGMVAVVRELTTDKDHLKGKQSNLSC